ncbi:MAG: anti-sigma factor antagonist [Oscillospiraceae bacterium]|nr:anti-sigma factor antagonist [Oscillospiraceae bacterium]
MTAFILIKAAFLLFGGVFLPVEIDIDETSVTAYISGEIDHHNAAALRQKIDEAVEMAYPQILIMDFGAVTFMDSSGIGLVMGRYKLMNDLRGKIAIENAPKAIGKVMRMAGIEKLISAKGEENRF